MATYFTKEQLAKSFAKSEEVFNLVGYIPMISILSAGIRTLAGKLQALIGLGFAIYSLVLGIRSGKDKLRHLINFRFSLEHFFHGLLNMLRAMIEAVPFLSLVTCLPYDRIFRKRFKYTFEDVEEVIEVSGEEIEL